VRVQRREKAGGTSGANAPCPDGGTLIAACPLDHVGLVDVHTHAIDPALPDFTRSHPDDRWPAVEQTSETEAWLTYGGRRYRHIDHRCWSPRARIADMDRDGIAQQVLSPIPVTFCYQASTPGAVELATAQNDFFARIVRDYPRRFRALAAVPLQDPDLAVDELRRCMSLPGFLGAEIASQIAGVALEDERLDRFFAVAHELGALLLIHPSDQDLLERLTSTGLGFGAGMPVETGIAAATLISSGAMSRRPGVQMCLAHGAGVLPAMIGRLDKGALIAGMAAESPDLPSRLAANFWCDSLTYNAAALAAAIDLFGADHVLLGSDYPFPAMPTPLDDILADLPTDLRERIGRRNLEKLHGTLPGSWSDALSPAGGH
jgi:aminocarboxymuconate-semialdehyde decarboxylase